MIKKSIKLLLIILCMISIFLFSSDTAEESDSKSNGLIINTAEMFFGRNLNINEESKVLNYFVLPVRKSAHFLIYFILGFLVISYIKEFNLLDNRAILLTILLCLVYACSDEIHQLSVPGRSGQILDVFIDTIGASVGCYCYYFIYKIKKRRCLNE